MMFDDVRMRRVYPGQHANRLALKRVVVAKGGPAEPDDLTIHPTNLIDVPLDAAMMQEEVFGPVLPVLAYDDLDEVAAQIEATGKPLAMYIFSRDDALADKILTRITSGGVTVNRVFMHYLESRLPFGGVNGSGMGSYKAVHGFRDLSHVRSIFVEAE